MRSRTLSQTAQETLPHGANQDLTLPHTHTQARKATQRQTDVLSVVLHYSEPGVGGKGNKVVFISCSLGVL